MTREYTRSVVILGQVPFVNQIIYHDDFEHTLHWTKGGTVGDFIFELDPTISKSGSQSLHIKTRTEGSLDTDGIYAKILMYLRTTKLVNIIANFHSPDFTKMSEFSLELSFKDGTLIHKVGVKYIPTPPGFQYMIQDENYAPIPDSALSINSITWHQLTLSANFNLHKYRFLDINHIHHDLSLHSTYSDTSTEPTYLEAIFQIINKTAEPCEIYIDDVTIHEL